MAIKCKICGNEFEPVIDKHYVARDLDRTGLSAVFSKDEVMLYDTFDCPVCGCQNTVQERKRAWFENQFEDDDDEVEEAEDEEKKMKRISKDQYYVDIALAVSKRSTCLKRHYGCVIVKDDIIIATGYNGSPRGEENCCDRGTCKRADAERYTGYENCDSVHAEQNALIATSRERLIGSTVYLACESYGLNREKSAMWEEDIYEFVEDKNPVPCGICARMLKNAGIVRVVNRRGDVCL